MNIVEQVGADYFSSRFGGSFFFGPNGQPCILQGAFSRNVVDAHEVTGPKTAKTIHIPRDFFQSFQFLTMPPLGWRSAQRGRVLVYLSRNNTSYTRGVNSKNIFKTFAPHTEYMFRMGKLDKLELLRAEQLLLLVANPQHMSMEEGMAELNAGKRMAFTNGDEIAIVPESNTKYNIYCGTQIVADITPEGEVTVREGCEDFESEVLK